MAYTQKRSAELSEAIASLQASLPDTFSIAAKQAILRLAEEMATSQPKTLGQHYLLTCNFAPPTALSLRVLVIDASGIGIP